MSDYDSSIIRKSIRVFGSVQGVGFRYRTEHAAESVGATGWVRNEPDGSVLMEIQGTEEQIDKVFAMVSQGTYVNIEKMEAKTIPVVEDERDFRTRQRK
jgi:acylphosphatase